MSDCELGFGDSARLFARSRTASRQFSRNPSTYLYRSSRPSTLNYPEYGGQVQRKEVDGSVRVCSARVQLMTAIFLYLDLSSYTRYILATITQTQLSFSFKYVVSIAFLLRG